MKSIIRIAMFLTLLTLARPTIASAQLFEPIRFTAPFAFEVGTRLLPAGTYVLAPVASEFAGDAFTLSGTTGLPTFLYGDGLGRRPNPRASSDIVVFEFDHGVGHYVMCQVWDSGEESGVQVNGTYALTRAAKALERSAPPDHEAIVPASPVVK